MYRQLLSRNSLADNQWLHSTVTREKEGVHEELFLDGKIYSVLFCHVNQRKLEINIILQTYLRDANERKKTQKERKKRTHIYSFILFKKRQD